MIRAWRGNMLNRFQKWMPNSWLHLFAALLGSGMLASAASILIYRWLRDKHQSYSDIIVGNIAWGDYYKSFDYYVVLGSFVCFAIVFLPVSRVISSLFRPGKDFHAPAQRFSSSSAGFILFVLAYSLFSLLFTGGATKSYVMILVAVPVISAAALIGTAADKRQDRFRQAVIAFLFVYVGVSGVVIALKNANISYWNDSHRVPLYTALAVWLTGLVLERIRNGWGDRLLKYSLIVGQALSPLVLLALIKLSYFVQGTVAIPYNHNTFMLVSLLVGMLMVWQVLYSIKQLKRQASERQSWIGIPALIATAFAMLYTLPSFSSLTSDDFHYGEVLLPWQQFVGQGLSYNIDFVSVQGLLGMLFSGINAVLYDGTVGSFAQAVVLVPCVIGIAITLVIAKLYGRQWALFYAVLYLPVVSAPYLSRFYLVAPILFIIFHPGLLSKPIRWFHLWFWLSVVHCFYNTTSGAALTLVTLPLSVYIIREADFRSVWRNQRHRLVTLAILQFVCIAMLVPSGLATIQFLLDNSASNTQAYGVGLFADYQGVPEWFPHWFSQSGLNRIVWESVRIGGWLFGICFLLGFFFYQLRRSEQRSDKFVLIYMPTVIAFILLVSSYSLGRIDPVSMNRSGSIAMLMIGAVIPLLFVQIYKGRKLSTGAIIALGVLLGFTNVIVTNNIVNIPDRTLPSVTVPEGNILVNGADYSLPKLGTLYAQPARVEEMVRFKETMDVVLKEGETFADLTNRSLFYFIMDKPVPSLYSADYLAMNEQIQSKVIRQLESNKPPLVWIGPSIRHDGGPSSLRAYRVYRWMLQQGYQYYDNGNGLQFMVRKDRLEAIGEPVLSDQANASKLAAVYGVRNLLEIPAVWGRSLSRMEQRFSEVPRDWRLAGTNSIAAGDSGSFTVSGGDAQLIWQWDKPVSGMEGDFLAFDLDLAKQPNNPFSLQVFWSGDGHFSEESTFIFNGHAGTFLLPVGSNPNWLLSLAISTIRFDVDGLDGVPFTLSNMRVLKLVK